MREQKLLYLTDYLEHNAKEFPDKPAIIFEGKTTSWNDLYARVLSGAAYLANKTSSEKQEIIGLLLANSPEFIITYLAIIHAGHIAMPLDPNFKLLEAQNVIDQMHPKLVITNSQHRTYFKNTEAIMVDEVVNADASEEGVEFFRLPAGQQVVSMLFTSGTTGNPKATPYTHANHLWNIEAVSPIWEWNSEDTLLISLPLSHWHGLCVGLTGMLVHANTMYLQARFDPEDTLQALLSGNISMFMHVPIAYSKLIEHKPNENFDISSVRLCISGSSFLPPAMWHKFKERFNQEILERYGASEMGFLTSNSLDSRVPGSVGKPLNGVTIEVQESGELAMRSPGLFPGYWNNEEATKEHLTENNLWLSGDIGEFDDHGNIHLKGRVQEKMKKFGYTVYPRDVEWAIMRIPGVREAAVISIQKEDQLSDDFIYFVVGDVEENAILDFAKSDMPNFWRPDKIILLDAIPRMGRANKPDLKKLRELAEK
jgi:acyl-CoA synthetase (AMP-forming)/AMP-acid ligase II